MDWTESSARPNRSNAECPFLRSTWLSPPFGNRIHLLLNAKFGHLNLNKRSDQLNESADRSTEVDRLTMPAESAQSAFLSDASERTERHGNDRHYPGRRVSGCLAKYYRSCAGFTGVAELREEVARSLLSGDRLVEIVKSVCWRFAKKSAIDQK